MEIFGFILLFFACGGVLMLCDGTYTTRGGWYDDDSED
jgi:hypothetical protein